MSAWDSGGSGAANPFCPEEQGFSSSLGATTPTGLAPEDCLVF